MSEDIDTVDVTLYSERAERFREIHADISDRLGYEPPRTEAVGFLMANWDDNDGLGGF